MSNDWTDEDMAKWWGDKVPASHLPTLAAACRKFGIDPDPDLQPVQLAAVKHYGNPKYFEEPSIRLVTAGGCKLKWPLDPDSEWKLRHQVFHAYRRDRRTGEIVAELPLPDDLTLPVTVRTGFAVRQGAMGQ